MAYAGESLGQLLFDAFCRDLDANLREMGVGDMGVPRRMRRFGEEFYGRQAAYHAALDGSDPAALENALARNIFELESGEARVSRLANYARASVAQLEDAKLNMLVSGENLSRSGQVRTCRALTMNDAKPGSPSPWHFAVAVEDVPETGEHFDLTADPQTRNAIAKVAGLRRAAAARSQF